ncbi:MAG: hypothetical protein NT031_17530 [Planctomycetota bacterium]|nr:hypothetical protein [Planctomycetota bacterium]
MDWPNLPDLLPWYTPAVKTSRDDLVVDVDKDNLVARMRRYFDPKTSNEELGRLLPVAMTKTATFDPETVRARLVKRGYSPGFLMTYAYRPLDMQWVYWELETNLLDRKREELYAARHGGNMFLTSRQKGERTREGSPFFVTSSLADYHLTRPGSTCFALFDPVPVGQPGLGFDDANAKGQRRPNLSAKALQYLETLSINPERNAGEADLIWMHVLAIGHSSGYLKENSGMLWQDWPRVPLPATRAALEASAALGRRVAALLDVEQPVKGVTTGMIDPALKVIGVITKAGTGGRPAQINDADDLALTAGWGHAGRGGITMPASGKTLPRDYTSEERAALCGESCSAGTSDPLVLLGPTTLDVSLNEKVYWRNIPTAVWEYTLGGYQVIKKWLSYREQKLLGRALRAEEARHVTDTSRRLAALLLLQPELDENYRRVKESCYDFKESQSGQ